MLNGGGEAGDSTLNMISSSLTGVAGRVPFVPPRGEIAIRSGEALTRVRNEPRARDATDGLVTGRWSLERPCPVEAPPAAGGRPARPPPGPARTRHWALKLPTCKPRRDRTRTEPQPNASDPVIVCTGRGCTRNAHDRRHAEARIVSDRRSAERRSIDRSTQRRCPFRTTHHTRPVIISSDHLFRRASHML